MPTTNTNTTEECRDLRIWCARFKRNGFCEPGHEKYNFTLENCRDTCGFCQAPEGCRDKNPVDCPKFAEKNCGNGDYQKTCAKTCGVCQEESTTTEQPTTTTTTTTTTEEPTCFDEDLSCPSYVEKGYCSLSSQYFSYMKQSCANSCQFCQPTSCQDTYKDCGSSWLGYCDSSFEFRASCRATCGYC